MSSEGLLRMNSAAEFAHTVVVVDDQAYQPGAADASSSEASATLGNDALEYMGSQDASSVPEVTNDTPIDPQDFDTETIVEAFAELGMVCGVLAPDPQGKLEVDRFLKVARRADAVVLDWIIRPTGGGSRNSLEFLVSLIKEDLRRGGRLRLICIYTGASAPTEIVDRIAEALEEYDPQATKEPDKLWVNLPGTRVVVLSKPRDVEIPGMPVVTAANLAKRVRDEFVALSGAGILPQIALASLAAVRDAAHRLLRRFDGDLDPALLAHRATTSAVATEQFALSLVGDELRALVTSSGAVPQLSDEAVREVVGSYLASDTQRYVWVDSGATDARRVDREDARKALTLGVDGDSHKIRETQTRRLSEKTSLTSLMLSGDELDVRTRTHDIDLRFSALSSLSRDSAHEGRLLSRPELRLGMIVSRSARSIPGGIEASASELEQNAAGSNFQTENPTASSEDRGETTDTREYWLCLQPICDSVRLRAVTRFPFLPLLAVEMPSDSFDLVIEDGGYRALKLRKMKFNQLEIFNFAPDTATSSVRAVWKDDSWRFTGADGRDYRWHGSVRIDKAYQLISSVLNDAGRIGISEYEYLRRVSK